MSSWVWSWIHSLTESPFEELLSVKEAVCHQFGCCHPPADGNCGNDVPELSTYVVTAKLFGDLGKIVGKFCRRLFPCSLPDSSLITALTLFGTAESLLGSTLLGAGHPVHSMLHSNWCFLFSLPSAVKNLPLPVGCPFSNSPLY